MDLDEPSEDPKPQTSFGDVMRLRFEGSDLCFTVHKDLICCHSEYFRTALSTSFKEGLEQEVCIDDDPSTVERFVRWLYTQRLEELTEAEEEADIHMNCELYVFADKRMVPDLKKAVIEQYVKRLNDGWVDVSTPTIPYVYNNTPEGSPLRRLVVDDWLRYYDFCDGGPAEFLRDIIRRLLILDKRPSKLMRMHINVTDYLAKSA